MPRLTKLPPERFYANDLAIHRSPEACGEDNCKNEAHLFYPHFGEWVDVKPFPSMSYAFYFQKQAEDRVFDDAARIMIFREVSRRVVAWNWTGDDGQPLPPPNLETIGELEPPEFGWLQQVLLGSAGIRENLDPNSDSSISTCSSMETEVLQPAGE